MALSVFTWAWDAVQGYELDVQFDTGLTDLGSAVEQRRANWGASRKAWILNFRKNSPDFPAIVAFFEARKGRYQAFNWTDPDGTLRTVRFLDDSLKAKVVGGIANITVTFIQVYDSDFTVPYVTGIVPSTGQSSHSLMATVQWTFSEPINAVDVNSTFFHIIDMTTGLNVDGSLLISNGSTVVTFTPLAPYTLNRSYMTRAEIGIRDVAGNQMMAAYGSLFTATAS